jgi:hypothetical protein
MRQQTQMELDAQMLPPLGRRIIERGPGKEFQLQITEHGGSDESWSLVCACSTPERRQRETFSDCVRGVILLAACVTSSPSPKKVTVMHPDDLADNPTAQLDRDNTVVCENIIIAGSHFSQRICMTPRERDLMRQQTQNTIDTQMAPLTLGR